MPVFFTFKKKEEKLREYAKMMWFRNIYYKFISMNCTDITVSALVVMLIMYTSRNWAHILSAIGFSMSSCKKSAVDIGQAHGQAPDDSTGNNVM